MYTGRTVFCQIEAFFPLKESRRCVDRYRGDYRESLRDIEACLRAMQPRLYHMGFGGSGRDWRIYADLTQAH